MTATTVRSINDLKLTVMEKTALISLINQLYAEAGFSDVDIHDIKKQTGIPNEQLRGVISSLVKKGIIDIDEHVHNRTTFQIIYLSTDYYYLHPRWGAQN